VIRYLTAGESHGPELSVIIEGFPAGISLSPEDVDRDLALRQQGYGRGDRMRIEQDRVAITSGVRHGETIGGPIALKVVNRDFPNWEKIMSVRREDYTGERIVTAPRPGHGDLAGHLKYDRKDMRDVLERASARETAMRVAAGAVARKFLAAFGVEVQSHVVELGGIHADTESLEFDAIREKAAESPVRTADPAAEKKMISAIDKARDEGDTLGGVCEILARGLVPGLGSPVEWDRKLDGRLAQALCSVQAMKGVEMGLGFRASALRGSEVHDEIYWRDGFYHRETNRAGGLEAGMTNGETLVLRVAMKPICTLKRGLRTVDSRTHEEVRSSYERSDVTAVPAAGVVLEAAAALVLADAYLEKFAGDTLADTFYSYQGYCRRIGRPEERWRTPGYPIPGRMENE
jgi:chorismate synthase